MENLRGHKIVIFSAFLFLIIIQLKLFDVLWLGFSTHACIHTDTQNMLCALIIQSQSIFFFFLNYLLISQIYFLNTYLCNVCRKAYVWLFHLIFLLYLFLFFFFFCLSKAITCFFFFKFKLNLVKYSHEMTISICIAHWSIEWT